jgi:uncharacterized OsmC-like protein
MAHSIKHTDSIDSHGYPLCFRTSIGKKRPGSLGLGDSQDCFVTQARAMGGHQKEAVVTEGEGGSSWRMVSDEGPALKGTDLAPFPLGYMSAALQGDLLSRLSKLAASESVTLEGLVCSLENDYMFEGSFFKGTGVGHAYPPRLRLEANSIAPESLLKDLLKRALLASPVLASWSNPLKNTFSLYSNGRQISLRDLAPSPISAKDPFSEWSESPKPIPDDNIFHDIVSKAEPVEVKNPTPASGWETGRVDIPIRGLCEMTQGIGRMTTWANRLGGSAFSIRSDDRSQSPQGPSSLALGNAGIAFCFMTQLLRYVEHHNMKVRALRLVQMGPCQIQSGVASPLPLDTHVFVNTEESDEIMERLVQMSARTCYLHAALGASLSPELSFTVNGRDLMKLTDS